MFLFFKQVSGTKIIANRALNVAHSIHVIHTTHATYTITL